MKEKLEIKENIQAQYGGYKKVVATFEIIREMLGTDAGNEDMFLKHNVKQINILPYTHI